MSERQKPITDKYRENYDRIFGEERKRLKEARDYDRERIERAKENVTRLNKLLGCDC